MNKDHVVAGIGCTGVTQMLATVFANVLHQASDTANAEAGLIVLGLGAAYALAQTWLGRRAAAPGRTAPEPVPTAA